VAGRDEPDVTAKYAAVEAEYRAEEDRADSTFKSRLKTWEAYCRNPGINVPLGPKGAARERDRAKEKNRAERRAKLEMIKLEECVSRLAAGGGEATSEEPKTKLGRALAALRASVREGSTT
jgi:hypothetical protein